MPSEKRARKREGRQVRQEELRRAEQRSRRNRQIRNAGILVVALVVVVFVITRLQDRGQDVATTDATATTVAGATTTTARLGTAPCPAADGSAERRTFFEGPPRECIDKSKKYTATITTDVGAFTVALEAAKAPVTVNSFVFLSRYHFYDGVTFHRVIPGFVVQGGDPKGDGTGGPGYQFKDELPKAGEYKVGSLAMANSGPDTNGSQFFVVTGEQGVNLPPSYSLFGSVTEGMDVVKKIEADGSEGGTPKVKHTIKTITIREG